MTAKMRNVVLKMSMSLDGYVCGPHKELDWFDWFDEDGEADEWTMDVLRNSGLHIMGSNTYIEMASYWPFSSGLFAGSMNELDKVIFTRGAASDVLERGTLAIEGALKRNATIVPSETILETWRHPGIANDDIREDIARLKAVSGKQILAHGGLAFAQSLIEHDLIDRYDLHVHPAVLGRGGSPFSLLNSPARLELVDLKRFPKGSVAQIYRRK